MNEIYSINGTYVSPETYAKWAARILTALNDELNQLRDERDQALRERDRIRAEQTGLRQNLDDAVAHAGAALERAEEAENDRDGWKETAHKWRDSAYAHGRDQALTEVEAAIANWGGLTTGAAELFDAVCAVIRRVRGAGDE